MRVTQSMITRNLMQSIQRNRENMSTLQYAIATGKEVHHSSNDPTQFNRASRFRSIINQNDQHMRTITDALGWVDATTGIVDDVYSKLMDIKELATQGADEGTNLETRELLAGQMDSIIGEVTSLFNTTYLGKPLFSGTATDSTSFDYDGTAVTYQGNSDNITRRVAENLNIAIGVTGQQVEDTGIFTAMISLRDALLADDTTGIATASVSLDSTIEQFTSLTTAYGSIQNHLTLTQQRLETANVNLYSYLSQTEDMDMTEAITQYNAEEMAYKAALQTTTDAINLNILDFI